MTFCKLYIQHTMVSLFFFTAQVAFAKKNIKLSTCFHFQGRRLLPNFMTINGKKQAFGCLFVAATPVKWWRANYAWYLLLTLVGLVRKVPKYVYQMVMNLEPKIPKFGRNNKKSGALVEIFQNILESTKNSSNSQSKTSLFTSQMRPFITKP